MKIWSLLHRLLPILAIVGLAIGPLAATFTAAGTLTAASMTVMGDDPPCCSHEKSTLPDCQKTCPLMATCMTSCALSAPIVSVSAFTLGTSADRMIPRDDWGRDGLGEVPPIRPPRT
ncbi:hypothetical protein CU048_10540 [Beijerinckiaceae bacterium]|nr:hypothetical protein CU048_10540 [Beijerinckiaceae bacterium]